MQATWGNQQCTSYISHGFAYAVRFCLILDYFAKDTYLRLDQDPGIYPHNGHVPAETDDTPRWHSGSMLHVREVKLQLMNIHSLGSGNLHFPRKLISNLGILSSKRYKSHPHRVLSEAGKISIS